MLYFVCLFICLFVACQSRLYPYHIYTGIKPTFSLSYVWYKRSILMKPAWYYSSANTHRGLIDILWNSKLFRNAYSIKQKRSTEGCSKFKSPETRQVQESLVSTFEHMQVPKWDRTRCPEE